jgi:hypothetical protein
VYDHIHIYKSEVRHNFSNYWADNNPSIFQKYPSPEVDEAWDRVANIQSIPLTADEVRQLGKDPATVWPAPKDEFGEGVYYGLIDIFHQTHCLNMLRKSAFPEYYGDVKKKHKHDPLKYDEHLLHCTYALLFNIMCHADVEVMVGHKFKGWPGMQMDFTSTKKCRNFQEILEWKERFEIIQKAPWSEYPDQQIVEMDPEGILTPYGVHLGLEEFADSENVELDIPSDLAWQPKESHHRHESHIHDEGD